MKNSSISILLLVLFAASMLLITGCQRVQNKVPTAIKVSGPSGTISQSSSTFTWTGSDSDGTIESYEYKKDSSVWVSIGKDTSYVWNDYSEGPHEFEIRAKDNEGGYSEPVSWDFTYHINTIPVITKAGGRSGITRQNSSAFYWTGEDNDGNISGYEYRKDEGSWMNHALDLSYIWSGYSEGPHKFEIRAQDNDGAYSNILTWNFTYDSDSSFPYAITVLTYWETDDLDAAVKSELGANATVADWDEIKATYSESIGEFIEVIGLGVGDEDILLQRNGEGFVEANNRHYFMTRFDGDVPEWYTVHDQIDDYTLVLGSSYGVKDRVLAKLSDNSPPVVTKIDGPGEETTDGSSTFVWTGVDSDGSIVEYEYIKDGGNWISNGVSTSYTWSGYSEGPHTFEVRAKDNQGEYSEPASWGFSFVQEEPLLLQIPDQTLNEGEKLLIDLTGYTTSGNATDTLTYTLISGIGEILGNSYTYLASYTDSGTKNVTIRVTDNKGRVDECSFQITVNNVTAAIVRVYDMETGEALVRYEASLMCENELLRTESTKTDILYLSIEGAELDSLEIKIAKSGFEVLQIPVENVIESEDVEFDIISLRLELSHAYVEQEGTYLIEKEIVLPSEVEKQIKYASNIMNEYPVSDGTLLVSGYDDLVNCGFMLSEDGRIIGTWSDIPGYSGSSISETGAADVIDSLIIIGGMAVYGVLEKTPENCAAVLDFAKELKEYEDAIDVYLQNAVADDYDMLQDDELFTLVAKIIYELDQELGPLKEPTTYHSQCVDCTDCEWSPFISVAGSRNGETAFDAVSYVPQYILVTDTKGTPVAILPGASVDSFFAFEVSLGELRFWANPFDCFSEKEFVYYMSYQGNFTTELEESLAIWAYSLNHASLFFLTLDAVFEALFANIPLPVNEIYLLINGLTLDDMGHFFIKEMIESGVMKILSQGIEVIAEAVLNGRIAFDFFRSMAGIILSTEYSIQKKLGLGLSWTKDFFPKVSSFAKTLSNTGKMVMKFATTISSGLNIGWKARYVFGPDKPENGCCSSPISQYPSFTDVQTPDEIYASVPAEMTATSDGDILEWDFDGNGQYDLSTNLRSATWTYKKPGNYTLTAAAINVIHPIDTELEEACLKTCFSKNLTVLESNSIPVVAKVSGPDGEVSESSSTFTWNGSDSDGTIVKYEYRKDEGSWMSNGTSTSYTWSGYSGGVHKFEVRAQDNKESYSDLICWDFSYIPPPNPPGVPSNPNPQVAKDVVFSPVTLSWTC
ncbi:MAG: hypothetical protein JW779_16505, partial [Candidatus Thorarchaeota archaeon]|nr:hypothetical protein [Candidatus Thorarchaeota archaeon]